MSTYTPIASIVSSSNASSVTFTGIPQTYTDLILNISVKHSSTVENHRLRFNGDTSASYADLRIFGTGTAAYTDSRENATSILLGEMSTGQFGADKWFIPQYKNTSFHKRIIGRSGNIGGNAQAGTGEYRSYDAITSITVLAGSGNFVNGSTFNLYGITSGSTKASGGTVTTDGTYFYHTFTSSGIFTPTQALTVDYLVVAGGGGGGSGLGGGGGAGGMRCTVGATGGGGSLETPLSLLAQDYTVQIGAGGKAVWANQGLQGSNSVFATITSTGGGGGSSGSVGAFTTGAGGSGGGGGNGFSAGARTASPVQGNNGGPDGGAAGGGGAGAVGGAGAGSSGGNGGNGQATSISGSSVTYAGGGGGSQDRYGGAAQGSGGTGGGGAGAAGSAAGTVATAGTANTGGGGGGGGNNSGRGNTGGSGIVIVRYAV